MYAKTQFFSWRCPFQRQLLCFQTIESAKRALAASADSSKFLENEKQNSRKKYGAMFSRWVQGHMQKLSSFGRGKKIWPKKSLTSFLHAALQLINCINLIWRYPVSPKRDPACRLIIIYKSQQHAFTIHVGNSIGQVQGRGCGEPLG